MRLPLHPEMDQRVQHDPHERRRAAPTRETCFSLQPPGPSSPRFRIFNRPTRTRRKRRSPATTRCSCCNGAINAELSATDRTGVARFTFPAAKAANILVPVATRSTTLRGFGARRRRSPHRGLRREPRVLQHEANLQGLLRHDLQPAILFLRHMDGRRTMAAREKLSKAAVLRSRRAIRNGSEPMPAGYPTQHEQTITAKIGISYVDVAGAEKNLQAEAEGKDFDTIRQRGRERLEQGAERHRRFGRHSQPAHGLLHRALP